VIHDPYFYLLAVPTILIIGISKSGFGGAFGGLGVPLLSIVIAPNEAAAILLPILCVMDVVGLRYFSRTLDWANLRILLPGALVGIAVGTLCFGVLNQGWLLLLVGAIGVAFPLLNWTGVARRERPTPPSRSQGLFWSALSGFSSFICHYGAPPLLVYLMPQKLDKRVFVGTTVVFFLVVNYIKLIPYYFLGQLRVGNLATSLVLLPMAPAGIYLGIWLQKRIKTETVYVWANILLFVAGWKLVFDGIRKLAFYA
jgi:uncharacterized membrane protein YfcA